MKRYLDLVPISARVHKKQNRMSIFCIALAVFLVTTIFGMADMFIRSQIIKTQTETGNWHIGIQNISSEDAAVIAARPDVTALAPYNVLNYGPTSILWTKKVERLCCFFKFLILLLLWCQITNRAMYPLTIIPALYVFKNCSAGFL